MKSKYIVLSAVTALALAAAVSCGDKKDKESSISEDIIKQPVTFSYSTDDEVVIGGTDDDVLNGEDPTAPADGNTEEATEYVPVTEANGEPVTTYVTVTDAAGEPETEANGETVTTAITVTTSVKVNSETQTTTSSGSTYVPYTDDAYAMWLDISTEEDFHFQDEFIQVTFKIRDTAPDGVYDINITNPDFASFVDNVSSVYPDTVLHGKVYVNQEAEPQREVTAADGFTVYADNVSGKQGEEVTVTFSMKENPGMCALNFWFDYDRNAMQIVECAAVGEFAEIASAATFGEPKN